MAEELTKTLTVKRKSKKSEYSIAKEDDEYILETKSSKVQTSVYLGDRIVGINGIPSGEFLDKDDANDLIESIRIVVIPKDNLDKYDEIVQDFDDDDEESEQEEEEDYEEYDRKSRKQPESSSKNSTALVAVGDSKKTVGIDIICKHCNHNNTHCEIDEDGDFVCEECGYVIEPPTKSHHKCIHCGHDNINLEKDDEGDYVCQECGHVIPDNNIENGQGDIYVCPDCSHNMINPLPDEEGDRVCEKCGCILPEKDSTEDEDKNSRALVLKEESNNDDSPAESSESSGGGGQQFDAQGRPTTNPDGKALTPADMFSPGDVITVSVGKSVPKQDPGLKIEERNGKYYVRKVPSGGLFGRTPVIAGDKILELNGIDSHEFKSLNEMKKILKEELKITVVVLRKDPDASDSSASSVDYDELKAIQPPDVQIKENADDDTAPIVDGECGCIWCPHCNEVCVVAA